MAPKVKVKKSAKRPALKPKQPAQRAGRTSTSRLSSKNQLTVPVDILRRVGLEAGDEVEFVVNDAGFIQIQVMADAHSVLNLVGAFPGVFDEFDQEKERAAWD
jgi:bifunctional DNA-binding transcriptional regulator/antitoxin component of YhaV-PrlF toxin-antitoxin module